MELKGCAGATTPPETTGAAHMQQPDRLPTPLLLSQPLIRGAFDQSFALPSTYEHKSPLHTETGLIRLGCSLSPCDGEAAGVELPLTFMLLSKQLPY